MYDGLLQMEMPGNIQRVSSSILIAFADDVVILATGHITNNLEEAINTSLDVVVKWMADMVLGLSIAKIEAIMLTINHGYQTPNSFWKASNSIGKNI